MIVRVWSPLQAAVRKQSSVAMLLFGGTSLSLVVAGAVRWPLLDSCEYYPTVATSLVCAGWACMRNIAGLAACVGAVAVGSMVTALFPHTGSSAPMALAAAAVTLALLPLAVAVSRSAGQHHSCHIRRASAFATAATTMFSLGLWCQAPGISVGVLCGGAVGLLWIPSTARKSCSSYRPTYLTEMQFQPISGLAVAATAGAVVIAGVGLVHDWQGGWSYTRSLGPAAIVAWLSPVVVVAVCAWRWPEIGAACLAALASMAWCSLMPGGGSLSDALGWTLGAVGLLTVAMCRDVLPLNRYAVVLAALTLLALAWATHSIAGVLPAVVLGCGCMALAVGWQPVSCGPRSDRRALAHLGPSWRYYALVKQHFDPVYRMLLEEPGTLGRVLDLGCGSGLIAVTCLRRGDVTAYTGIDLDYDKLLAARRWLAFAGRPLDGDWRLLHADLPLQTSLPTVDTVFLIDVLHYWSRQQQADMVRQAVAAMAPDGRLYLREGCRSASGSMGSVGWIERFSTWIGLNPAASGLTFMDKEEMAILLEGTGLRVERTAECGDHNVLWCCRRA